MATVFGNEFRTSTFSNEVNGMKLTGDLRVDSNNKIESISGTFTKGDEFVYDAQHSNQQYIIIQEALDRSIRTLIHMTIKKIFNDVYKLF